MTQNEAILNYLKQGYSLTGLGALRLFGTMKISTRISELKREGYEIKDCYVFDPNSKKKYKKYWMEAKETYREEKG
jgi:hypothetical protein